MNITDILTEHARIRSSHPAIEDGERVVTYGELDSLVDAAATNLHVAGVGTGDIVAVLLDDSADHLIILYALARAGAVIFSLNSNASKAELESSLASATVKAVITPGPRLPGADLVWLRAEDICRPAQNTFDGQSAGGGDPVMLVQSSGTTGAPKSFVRSHADFVQWIERHARHQGWTAAERSVALTHMSFNVGRNVSLGMLRLGATVVINHTRSPEELATLVRDKRISYLQLAPSHMIPLLDHAADKAPLFPGLRAMCVGHAPTTHEQRLLARERLNLNCFEQFGANEAGLLSLALPADQDAYPESVGRVIDGIEAQIVDDEDRPVPAGEVGQVRFRGAGYPTRYLDDAQATARAFRGGWFYPGDLAALNEEGYLFFKGRADDVINNGGAKFYPIEVEIALLAHPDVREAAVFGWPHTRFGEVAVACVVTNSRISIQDLQTFCKQRLAGYKVPEIIEVKGELPRNAMGKILKRELKDTIERTVVERQAKR
ncbi:MAG: class I adenylate-forming enzyme family protein [Alphaproteobacteria bacterium]|nr:class I adenylate-forming enzyme family protein [Alphaproteobacteria bacterium]